MTAWLKDVIGYGTHSARPAAGSAGALYYETDTGVLFRDNGSTWDATVANSAGALQKIDEVIVGSGGATTIPFSGIPDGFRNLQVVLQGRGDDASNNQIVQIQFNGDTGANYDWTEAYGYSVNTQVADQATAQTSGYCGYIPAATAVANSAGTTVLWIPNYAETTFHKGWHATGEWVQATTGVIGFNFVLGGRWRSTAKITSMLLFPASGKFVTNSVASLYGIS